MVKFREKTAYCLQLIILVLLPAVADAQPASELKKIFAQAESYFLYEEYELANQLYILLETPDNFNIKYKIGVCYLSIPGEKDKSIPYLEEAVKNASYEAKEELFKEKKAPLEAYFYLAKAYMINNDLEKGLNTLGTFKKLVAEYESGRENLGYVDQQIQACQNAILLKEKPVEFRRKMLGGDFTLGSLNENAAVSYDGNTIVYTERRGITNALFFSRKIRGIWQAPVEITTMLNAGEDCSTCSLNGDGTELYLYKTDNYDGAIYVSDYVNESWTPIKKLNRNINTKFYESHAAISADGKKLYFTSNREGGFGNLDLYVSEKDGTGEWGPAKNLGKTINTPYNEDTPFITKNDSLLYFSSEGHSSMGGYDNFRSALSDSSWQDPVNIGYPVNTTDDDKFFQPLNGGSNAYYSMTTDYKKKDIFYLEFGDITFDIKGKVTLADTAVAFDEKYPVYLTNKSSGDTISKGYPDIYTGNYGFKVRPGSYSLNFTGYGFFTEVVDTSLTADNQLSEIFIDVILKRDSSVIIRSTGDIIYEKINLSEIPTIDQVDTAMLVTNVSLNDVSETRGEDQNALYYTVQVIALYNPCDVSYFKYINDIKIVYDERDRFYRYTTGVFEKKEDAYKWRLELVGKGYPDEIFVKKVSKR